MPSTVGDIFEVTDRGYNNDQVNLNVYHFILDSVAVGGTSAQALAEAFADQRLPLVSIFQNTSFLHTAIEVKNLFDPTDSYTLLVTEPGQTTNSDELSVFLAIDTALEHNNSAVRQGRKAYGGLDENQISNGLVSGAGLISSLAALMTALADPLSLTLSATWLPIVLSSLLSDGSYGTPTNASQAVYGEIQTATYNPLVSTQNTRKIGRGV